MNRGPRDYRAEYTRRIARGLARGLSRSQARGHPKPSEALARGPRLRYDPDLYRRLEEGLKALRSGKSLTTSARTVRVAPERLRRYVSDSGIVERRGRKWIVGPDDRKRDTRIYSNGEAYTVTVDVDTAAEIGRYLAAVRQFLATNDPTPLAPFHGRSITDLAGRRHPLETDPNALYRLDATGEDSFEDVYRIIV
jgi:hypothetical protein